MVEQLSARLATLQPRVEEGLDLTAIAKDSEAIDANLNELSSQLSQLKDSKDFKYNKLVKLRKSIKKQLEIFNKINDPLSQDIRQLESWRRDWLGEKQRWQAWQSYLLKESDLPQLKSAFDSVDGTIDKALSLIRLQLEAALQIQQTVGNVQTKINRLADELDRLILAEKSPPMFSSQYFSQFKSGDLWYSAIDITNEVLWPDSQFFKSKGWVILFGGFLACFSILAINRNRRGLGVSKHWRFIAARPVSAGLFLSAMVTALVFEYKGVPAVLKLTNSAIAGIAFARLSGNLIETSWKRQFVYGLISFLTANSLMEFLSFPLPIIQLYTFLAALGGLVFCLWWDRKSLRHRDSDLFTPFFHLGSLFFAVIVIAELWGKQALASYLFVSMTRSLATVIVFMLLMYMLRGGLEWLLRSAPPRLTTVMHMNDKETIIHRVARVFDCAVFGLVLLPAILLIWGVYDSMEDATRNLLALGFNLGSHRITVGLLAVSIGIVYGTFFTSWMFEKLFMSEALLRRRVERGVRISIARLVRYMVMFVGFLFALSVLGFELTKLIIMLSALGVGIGLGLQSIVNNFISGLILLFERPVRVGDYIEFAGNWAEIRRIGLRSTTVLTFDQADLIIPNADLVTNYVTNWTLSDRLVRIHLPLGVAYGSDIALVMETLMDCAKANPKVAKIPVPQVLFLNFGESSLDFELRVWVLDVNEMMSAKSELNQEIDRRFREANIEIAFPQRDLHVRNISEAATLQISKTST